MATDLINYETLLDHLQDGVYLVDAHGEITFWNRGAERILGYTRDEVIGKATTPAFLAHAQADGTPFAGGRSPVALCLEEGLPLEEEVFVTHRSGHQVPVYIRVSPVQAPGGETIGALEVFSDNSSRMQARRRIKELEELALLCPVTGVGNRRYAEMALQSATEELNRFEWPFGVLFVDVDHFKQINDTYGHPIGDEVLRMAAHALRNSLRSFDFVGRWGGEEFVIVLPNITDEILERVGERCRQLIEISEYQSEGRAIQVTVSIGGTMARPGETAQACVDRADRLMYTSKQQGRNRVTLDP